jgi:hypothetical protein
VRVQRRRRFGISEKLRAATESGQSGMTVSFIEPARRRMLFTTDHDSISLPSALKCSLDNSNRASRCLAYDPQQRLAHHVRLVDAVQSACLARGACCNVKTCKTADGDTAQAILRGSFESMTDLKRRIDVFVKRYNQHPRPFAWGPLSLIRSSRNSNDYAKLSTAMGHSTRSYSRWLPKSPDRHAEPRSTRSCGSLCCPCTR